MVTSAASMFLIFVIITRMPESRHAVTSLLLSE